MKKKQIAIICSAIFILILGLLFNLSELRTSERSSTFDMANIIYNPIFIAIITLFSIYYIYIAIKFIINGLKK